MSRRTPKHIRRAAEEARLHQVVSTMEYMRLNAKAYAFATEQLRKAHAEEFTRTHAKEFAILLELARARGLDV